MTGSAGVAVTGSAAGAVATGSGATARAANGGGAVATGSGATARAATGSGATARAATGCDGVQGAGSAMAAGPPEMSRGTGSATVALVDCQTHCWYGLATRNATGNGNDL